MAEKITKRSLPLDVSKEMFCNKNTKYKANKTSSIASTGRRTTTSIRSNWKDQKLHNSEIGRTTAPTIVNQWGEQKPH
jgi:hypothetical protein